MTVTPRAQIGAHVKAAYGTLAAAGDLTVCQGEAYQLQLDLLILGAKAVEAAQALIRRHPEQDDWGQVLEAVGRDLNAFRDALVGPAKAEEPGGR